MVWNVKKRVVRCKRDHLEALLDLVVALDDVFNSMPVRPGSIISGIEPRSIARVSVPP
jgi:hypothetical protein